MSSSNKLPKSEDTCRKCSNKELEKQYKEYLKNQLVLTHNIKDPNKIEFGYAGGVNIRRVLKTTKATKKNNNIKKIRRKRANGGVKTGDNPSVYKECCNFANYLKGLAGFETQSSEINDGNTQPMSPPLLPAPHKHREGPTSLSNSMGPPPTSPPKFSKNVMPANLEKMKEIFDFAPYYDNKIYADGQHHYQKHYDNIIIRIAVNLS